MSKKTCFRITGIILIVLLLFGDVALTLPSGGVTTVDAGGPGPNVIVGLFRAFGALSRRNRIYREARATSQEINDYYDQLIVETSSQRQKLIQQAIEGEKPPEFARSYVRLEAALEAERAAAIEMVEQEKNQARINFEQTLMREFTSILIASPGGQKIVRDVRDTIARTREAAVAVLNALEGGKPTEALAGALVKEFERIPVVQEVSKDLGSMAGHQLDQALGGFLTKLDEPVNNMQDGLGEAITKLDEIDGEVAQYDGAERKPVSLLEDDSLVGEIIPVVQDNATVDVVASAFAGAAEIKGLVDEGMSRKTMKDRIRGALLADRMAGLATLKQGQTVGKSFCTAVGQGTYQTAAAQLEQQPQGAETSGPAAYLVCYDLQSGQPVYAGETGADNPSEQATITALEEENSKADDEKEQATPTVQEEQSADADLGEESIYQGIYVGKTSFPDTYNDIIFFIDNINENAVTIEVSEDGTVSGFYSIDVVIYCPGVMSEGGEACPGYYKDVISGTFQGTLTEDQNSIQAEEIKSCEILSFECDNPSISCRDVRIMREFDVQVTDDLMTGKTTLATSEEATFIWTFEATKQ